MTEKETPIMFRKMKKAEVPKIQKLVHGFWKRRMDVAGFKEMFYQEIAAMFTKTRYGVPFKPTFYLAARGNDVFCVAGVLKDSDSYYQVAYLTANERNGLWRWFENQITDSIWGPAIRKMSKQGKTRITQGDLPKIEFCNSPPWFFV